MDGVISFIVLLSSIPVGFILKKLTKEEIQKGKFYFKIIWLSCLILSVGFLFFKFDDIKLKKTIIFSLLFIADVAFISWR